MRYAMCVKIMGMAIHWRVIFVFALVLVGSSIPIMFAGYSANDQTHINCQHKKSITSGIQYPMSEQLKNTKMYKIFTERREFLKKSCQYAQSIHLESPQWTHTQRLNFQHQLLDPTHCMAEEPACIPALPKTGGKLEHFYNDLPVFKFAVCLPTKTGSTNWLRGLVSLIKMGNPPPEDLIDSDIWYGVDRFPTQTDELTQFRKLRTSAQGYMTMMTVRDPLARLYSAWKDKFRNKNGWMKYIEKEYGPFLKNLETHDMSVEQHEYSFEAFLELVAITDGDHQRDKHWQTFQHYWYERNIYN